MSYLIDGSPSVTRIPTSGLIAFSVICLFLRCVSAVDIAVETTRLKSITQFSGSS